MSATTSLHVGVNWVNAGVYGDRFRALNGCDVAARQMADLAKAGGFKPRVLSGENACYQPVRNWLDSQTPGADGDVVLMTYAGHGTTIKDHPGRDEDHNQALVLFDSVLEDDTIYDILTKFKKGVFVVFVFDSCVSGSGVTYLTASRMTETERRDPRLARRTAASAPPAIAPRPSAFRNLMPRERVAADVLLLAASGDTRDAPASTQKTLAPPFTTALLRAWAEHGGRFPGGYRQLHAAIQSYHHEAELFDRLVTHDRLLCSEPPFSRRGRD